MLCVGTLHEKDGRLAPVKVSNGSDGQDDILEASGKRLSMPPVEREGICRRQKIRFGTIGAGLDLARLAWPNEHHVFSSQVCDLTEALAHRPKACSELGPPNRLKPTVLTVYPVDVLLVEYECGPNATWVRWLDETELAMRPKVIVAMGDPANLLDSVKDATDRVLRKRMKTLGYAPVYWLLQAHKHGAALQQDRLVTVFQCDTETFPGTLLEPEEHSLPCRPMSNLLMPVGVPKGAWSRSPTTPLERGLSVREPFCVTRRVGRQPVFDVGGSMPDEIDAWIATERGVRRLQSQELAKGKGLPSEWMSRTASVPRKPAQRSTSAHIWCAVGDSVAALFRGGSLGQEPSGADADGSRGAVPENLGDPVSVGALPVPEGDCPVWEWEPEDLCRDGDWYRARVLSLQVATEGMEDRAQLIREGLRALEVHRGNYTEEGPQYLQLLWWEFPPEHREAIRTGSSMNFLVNPSGELELNSNFPDPEQLATAVRFFEELVKLGVLQEATTPVLANCPLFIVEKPGQKGQWRCIADCKRGGQNDCSGKDPVYLSRSGDILPHLYSGGWSAIADASKHFHNFPTCEGEREYLGCMHPLTGARYWYAGLPMGTSNSPAVACRIGNGVLRMLRDECPAFQGTPTENSWRRSLAGEEYLTGHGHGRFLMGDDGSPAAQIWGHVDDYFCHAATQSKCDEAFNAFLDLTVRLGFICQKVKTSPPAQVQKFCGFLYDTTSVPTLRIPEDKVTRARATINYLRSSPVSRRLGRLTLTVALGRLESLVDATPQRIGHTYLRRLYDELHDLPEMSETVPRWAMFTLEIVLSEAAWEDLEWWYQFLHRNPGCVSRTATAGSLAASWGDGSGTGTGGTIEKAGTARTEPSVLDVWMGTWALSVQHHTSNWKELRTMLRTLERERGGTRLQGLTLFYFTDNLVSYYIMMSGSSSSAELHRLIRRIQLLLLELGCRLEVVHVPGTLMIHQGADGLSRGMWLSAERVRVSSLLESSAALNCVPFSFELAAWALAQVGLPPWSRFSHHTSLDPWRFADISGQLSIWTPTPEVARQAITAFLDIWVEDARTTSALFLVPRVIQRDWQHVSRHVVEIGTFYPDRLPHPSLVYDSLIPFVLLFVPRYVRALPPDRGMESATSGSVYPSWIRDQVDSLRGL